MASEIKLLPCPCCGAEAKVMIPQGHYFTFYQVVCTECELASKATPTVDMAVELWNTRKPMDRIVEKLQHAKEMTLTDMGISYNRALDFAITLIKKAGGKV